MGKNKYVGHRYIPIFENGWDKTRTYDPLTFVYYEGKTYVSRQLVPTNIEITDNDFWAFFMDNAPQIFTPTFTGQWEDKPYEPLSIVIDNGNTYVSKQDVPVGTLLTDETYWLDLSTYYNQLFIDYETAEQERQQAEAIRVENENQRVLAYDKVDMIGKVKLINDIDVSIFDNGDREITKTPELNQVDDNITKHLKNNIVVGDKYYISIEVKTNGNSGTMLFYSAGGGGLNYITTETTNEFKLESKIVTGASKFSLVRLTNIAGKPQATDLVYRKVYTINLTKTFGAGNEPTKDVMDWIVNNNSYFDELTLKRDDLQQYEINQLRKAVIALGGTI